MDNTYKTNKGIIVVILIVLIACNLRAPFTGVGSLVNIIGGEFGMSASMAGMLTTIPLLAFAAISPITVFTAERIGAGRLFIVSFAVLVCGIIIRSCMGEAGLFIGTVVIGGSIAVGNVLLPAVIKSKFPERIGAMTSLYTVIMQIVSAVSTAVSVPISVFLGWKAALGVWLIPAAITLVFCIFNKELSISKDNGNGTSGRADGGKEDVEISAASLSEKNGGARAYGEKTKSRSLYKSPMTWWITAYMGIQSMMFYSFIAWLSPMMQTRGYDDVFSGYLLSLYVVMGMAGSAALPVIMKRSCSQSVTGVILGVLYLMGMICMLLSSYAAMLVAGIVLCGFCSGTCISFSMALFGLHTSGGKIASKLSGTAQSIGYLLAAAGPVLLGKVFDISGSWSLPLTILAAAAVFLIVAGKIVGREEIIE